MPDPNWTSDDVPGDIPDRLIQIKQTAFLRLVSAAAAGSATEATLLAVKLAIDDIKIDVGDIEELNVEMSVLMDQVETFLAHIRGGVTYTAGVIYGPESMTLVDMGDKNFQLDGVTAFAAVKVGDRIILSTSPSDGTFAVVGTPDGDSIIIAAIPGGDAITAFGATAGVQADREVAEAQHIALLAAIDATLTTMDGKIPSNPSTEAKQDDEIAELTAIKNKGPKYEDVVAGAYPMKVVDPAGADIDSTNPQPVKDVPKSTDGTGNVQTLTAVEAQLTSYTAEKQIRLQADDDNTSDIYLGWATGVLVSNAPIRLAPGQVIWLDIDDSDLLWGITGSGSQDLRIMGV